MREVLREYPPPFVWFKTEIQKEHRSNILFGGIPQRQDSHIHPLPKGESQSHVHFAFSGETAEVLLPAPRTMLGGAGDTSQPRLPWVLGDFGY